MSNGDVSIPKCEAILREIYREHGRRPDVVSSKMLIEGGENWKGEYIEGLKDHDLAHLWNDALHYNDLRSKNDLGESELLVVLGSPGRSDLHYKFQAGLHGECAIPATDDEGERLSGLELDYQNEVANDILDTTRKGEVFQAAMRAGRRENTEATIYIATWMVPDWLDVTRVGQRRPDGSHHACLSTRTPNEKAVIEVLSDEDGISGREVARRADIPKTTALDALNRLRDGGQSRKSEQVEGQNGRLTGSRTSISPEKSISQECPDLPIITLQGEPGHSQIRSHRLVNLHGSGQWSDTRSGLSQLSSGHRIVANQSLRRISIGGTGDEHRK